jgi:Arc/MetJ family transcription regulator
MASHKTAIVVDDELVAEARAVLGTKGLTSTIDAALRAVVDAERRRRHVERLRSGPGDLGDPDVMGRAWQHG